MPVPSRSALRAVFHPGNAASTCGELTELAPKGGLSLRFRALGRVDDDGVSVLPVARFFSS